MVRPRWGTALLRTQKVSVGQFELSKWKDFSFFNPTLYPSKHPNYDEQEDLEDQNADAQGNATLKADLSKYANACYRVDFDVEGFESNGGRSVHRSPSHRVRPGFCGRLPNRSPLDFLPFNQPASIELLAVNQVSGPDWIEQLPVSSNRASKRASPDQTGQWHL